MGRKNIKKDKHRIINWLITAVLLIAMFGVGLHFLEGLGVKDEQFGDTGDWGEKRPKEYVLQMKERDYYSTDDIDAYLLFGTDDPKEGEEGFNGPMADFLALLLIDNTTERYAFIQIDRNTMTLVDVLDENGESTGAVTEQICIAHWYGRTDEQRNNNTVAAVCRLLGGLLILLVLFVE